MRTPNLANINTYIHDPYAIAGYINQAYAEALQSTTEDRAWNISNAVDDVLRDYRNHLLSIAIKTDKAHYITADEAKHIHPIYKTNLDPREAIYINDPEGIRIPELYGASSRNIILNGNYKATAYFKETLKYWNHNTLYGWENGEPVEIEGSDRPHMSDKRKIREYMKACHWQASLNEGAHSYNASPFTLTAFVDFSSGNSFAVGTFHRDLSKNGENIISRYGNAPARYLAKELAVGKHDHVVTKATFISDNIAVITTLAGDKPEGVLTCLTVTTPPPFTLTGKTLTIEAIECTGENQPATITFQAN